MAARLGSKLRLPVLAASNLLKLITCATELAGVAILPHLLTAHQVGVDPIVVHWRRRITMRLNVTLLLGILGSGLFLVTGQQSNPAGIFTSAQAEAGRVAYDRTCGKCHTNTLLGRKGDKGELPLISSLSAPYQKFIGARGFVPPLAGKTFIDRWGEKTAAELIARFQVTADDPFFQFEDMKDETTVDITAYVLQVNGAIAGPKPLTRKTAVLVSSITR